MVNVDEPCILHPAYQVLPWRAIATHLVARAVEYFTELNKHVGIVGTSILAVAKSVEILKFDPAARDKLTVQVRASGLLPGELKRCGK